MTRPVRAWSSCPSRAPVSTHEPGFPPSPALARSVDHSSARTSRQQSDETGGSQLGRDVDSGTIWCPLEFGLRDGHQRRHIADCADLTIVPMLQPKPLPCRATCLVRSAQSAGAVGSQRLCPMRPMRALLKSDRRRCATQATRNGLVTLASVRSTSLSIRAPARPEHRARPRPGGPGREVVGRGLCRPRERGSPAHVSDPPVRSAQS